jgi:hypothetical protein
MVVARVAAAAAVASEATTRTTIEAAKQSVEDRATAAPFAAATTMTERDSLVMRLALAKAEIEKLWAAAASANEVAERATTTTVAAEAAARDAT